MDTYIVKVVSVTMRKKRKNKMTNYYTEKAVINYLQDNEVVESYKVTRVQTVGFNQMEGLNYLVNVSVKTQEGYKDKRIKMVTNSSYLEEIEWDEKKSDEENFSEWLSIMVGY